MNIRPYVTHKKHIRLYVNCQICENSYVLPYVMFSYALHKVREWMKFGPYVTKLHKCEPDF